MDVKVAGVPVSVLAEAFAQAKVARLQILDVMREAIAEPRPDINPRAPKILTTTVKVDQIGLVIGPGGKTVTKIREETGADIDIEDDGTIYVTGKNGSAEAAIEKIESLTHEYKEGECYTGPVTKIFDFGALVKIGEGVEGLVHVSEIAPFRIENVSDALTEGEEVPVVVKEVNKRENKISLSIKQADAKFAEKKGLAPKANPPKPHGDKPTKGK
jgi:polyribonucleotide nucleotidyltransferase